MPSRQTTVRFASTCYTFALPSISSSCRWGQDRATKTPKISVRRNRLCQMIRVQAWFLPQILRRISMFRMKVTRCIDVKWLSQLYKGATNEARISTLCSFWKQRLGSVWEYLLKCLLLLIMRRTDINMIFESWSLPIVKLHTIWESETNIHETKIHIRGSRF